MSQHFSMTRYSVTFDVEGADDVYQTKAALAAEVPMRLRKVFTMLGDKDGDSELAFEQLKATYRKILTAESWALFEPRITGEIEDDDTVPIDMATLIQVTRWLIGEGLGKGTSPQAASSPDGSNTNQSGPSSTGGASLEGSNLSTSRGVDS